MATETARLRWRVLGAAALLLCLAAPAAAHPRVFVGAGFYGPYPYPYYYPYTYPYYAPYPYPYPYGYPVYGPYSVPPPGWEPGHWEWRRDAGGRWIQTWVPPYLR